MANTSFKRIARSRPAQIFIGTIAAWYLRLVWRTSRFAIEPADIYEQLDREFPVIIAMWHGQHFMTPFAKLKRHRAKSLISRHHDGEINAIAAEKLGVETIRGSGSHSGDFYRKGGAAAFHEMLASLAQGYIIALTADVPKVSRVCGLGIIKLAQHSGRKILPVAIATSRRIELNNWDRSAISLPFSRGVILAGNFISVPRNAGNATLETLRQAVEDELNAVTARAYARVDRKKDSGRG